MKFNGKFNERKPTRDISIPQWATKIIKGVDVDAYNVDDSRKTRGKKHHGSVSLMTHMLEHVISIHM
jgi:hypothetical protein